MKEYSHKILIRLRIRPEEPIITFLPSHQIDPPERLMYDETWAKVLAIVLYILFAWILVYFDEVIIGYELYKLHELFLSVSVPLTCFTNYSNGEKTRFQNYYEGICNHNVKRKPGNLTDIYI